MDTAILSISVVHIPEIRRVCKTETSLLIFFPKHSLSPAIILCIYMNVCMNVCRYVYCYTCVALAIGIMCMIYILLYVEYHLRIAITWGHICPLDRKLEFSKNCA